MCCAGTLSTRGRVQFEGCAAEPDRDDHLARVQVELFASTYCVASCVE